MGGTLRALSMENAPTARKKTIMSSLEVGMQVCDALKTSGKTVSKVKLLSEKHLTTYLLTELY